MKHAPHRLVDSRLNAVVASVACLFACGASLVGSLQGTARDILFLQWLAGVFGVLGIVFAAFRGGWDLHENPRAFTRWWGLPFPLRRTRVSVDGVTHVEVALHLVFRRRWHRVVSRVRLCGSGQPVDVAVTEDGPQARRLAESLCRFWRLPLHDESSGDLVVREFDEVDLPLWQRLVDAGKPPRLPPDLKNAVATQRRTEEGLRVDLPAPRVDSRTRADSAVRLVALLILCPLGFLLASSFFPSRGGPVVWWVGAACLAFLVVLELLPLRALKTEQTTVLLTAAGLEVITHGGGSTRRVRLPLDELEELVLFQPPPLPEVPLLDGLLPRGTGLLARGDAMDLRFGEHLPAREQRHLHAVMLHVIHGLGKTRQPASHPGRS
jgi:hypothetical protein